MSLRRPSNSRIRLHPTFDSYLKDKRAKQRISRNIRERRATCVSDAS